MSFNRINYETEREQKTFAASHLSSPNVQNIFSHDKKKVLNLSKMQYNVTVVAEKAASVDSLQLT